MKKTLNLFVATITFCLSLTMLSACSSGGGDSSASGGPGPGPGAFGSGTSGYVGNGTWNGSMVVRDVQTYQQFLYDNNLCSGWQCQRASAYFQLQISTAYLSGGYLPGPVVFVLRPFIAGSQVQAQSQNADGYINGSNNGLLLNYNGDNSSGGCDPTFGGCNIAQSNQVMLQISTQYIDATHNTMNVQVYAYGRLIANGTMQGFSGYNNGNQNFTGTSFGPQYQQPVYRLYNQRARQ